MKTTLCYIEKDNKYLMLYRNKKKNDPNEGKWVGIGGKFEEGETPDECVVREVKEETGLRLTSFKSRGLIHFVSDTWNDEDMYLYSADAFDGELSKTCNEGTLKWINKQDIMELSLWEGDRVFLKKLIDNENEINLTLKYQGEVLIEIINNI